MGLAFWNRCALRMQKNHSCFHTITPSHVAIPGYWSMKLETNDTELSSWYIDSISIRFTMKSQPPLQWRSLRYHLSCHSTNDSRIGISNYHRTSGIAWTTGIKTDGLRQVLKSKHVWSLALNIIFSSASCILYSSHGRESNTRRSAWALYKHVYSLAIWSQNYWIVGSSCSSHGAILLLKPFWWPR